MPALRRTLPATLIAAVLTVTGGPVLAAPCAPPALRPVARFGANPSGLEMYVHVPARAAPRPALLVAIHDCAGSARSFFDGGAHDFVTAAEQYGFVVVFPETTRAGACFDTSSPAALVRGGGSDPVGIMSMVGYARRAYHVDSGRTVVTGSSMAGLLAAEYPEVFAAASVFSGMPAGCTDACAGGLVTHTAAEWGELARSTDPGYRGRYPRMQLWHGTADTTVAAANLAEELKQWTGLAAVSATPVVTDNPEPTWSRTRYGDPDDTAPVEAISVAGAGHTLPLHLMASYAIGFLGLTGNRLPAPVHWTSSGPLIAPRSDATHSIVSVKDPSVLRYRGRWLVYATTVNSAGKYSMEFLSFADWADAAAATPYYLDQSAIGPGYRAAPELFYFAPQKLWYLVYQSDQGASYSTTTDPTKPATWSAPQPFFATMPEIIRQNIGTGYWVDMWVTCDRVDCYLFSSDDNGHLYRSRTTLADFPAGFGDTAIVLDSPASKYRLFEASNVYRIKGTGQYLLIVEASASARYFRAWTSNRLDGAWTPLAGSQAAPFAGAANVTFTGTPWTTSISHGEMLRSDVDQTLTVDPHHLQYLYQGVDPASTASYTFLPWHLGLLTLTGQGQRP